MKTKGSVSYEFIRLSTLNKTFKDEAVIKTAVYFQKVFSVIKKGFYSNDLISYQMEDVTLKDLNKYLKKTSKIPVSKTWHEAVLGLAEARALLKAA